MKQKARMMGKLLTLKIQMELKESDQASQLYANKKLLIDQIAQ